MKKSFHSLKYLLLAVVSVILVFVVGLLETIPFIQEMLQEIEGKASIWEIQLFMLVGLILLTIGGIVYVRIKDRKKENNKQL